MKKPYILKACIILLSVMIVSLTACNEEEGTTGCNDSMANNSGSFDNDCDDCCTYDKEKFIGSYDGTFDCIIFGQLDSDMVTFDITEGFFSTQDSVNVQIFTGTLVLPTPSRISNDSIFISTFVENVEIELNGELQMLDLDVDGVGIFIESENRLVADLTLGTFFMGLPLEDSCVFDGVKQ